MPATFKGDMGIKVYTRTGIVFQCYCPDEEYEPKKMYEAKRRKVTKDLGKLKLFKDALKSYLESMKI
ncbi:hypothetical protein CN570_28675 [Bacillus toyonensis]|nr:hypothetical protein CN633_16060 [Bacillus toyonensis]PEO73346.1 hypothetical protein CN570_28675 [Bacillus toyonensis]